MNNRDQNIRPPKIFKDPQINWKDISRYVSEILNKNYHHSVVCQIWRGRISNNRVFEILKEIIPQESI